MTDNDSNTTNETSTSEFKARYAPDECADLPYQAMYYSGTKYHEDGYERGGWYATEQEAIDGARRGKATHDMFDKLFKG